MAKIKLLIDANPLVGNKSGVGHFTERLIDSLASNPGENLSIYAYYFNFLGLKKVVGLPQADKIQYIEVTFLPSKLLSILHRFDLQLPLELFLGFRKYDFMIFPNFVAIPSLRKTPYALAVHDMSFEDCPEYLSDSNRSYLHRFVRKSVRKSSLIITISNFTKQRIAEFYKSEKLSDIIVMPVPYEKTNMHEQTKTTVINTIKKPFILYVGTIEPRKNIERLVKGFAAAPLEIRQKYDLVLAGNMGWKTESIKEAIDQVKNDITIIQTGYISDADRNILYERASLVCLLSHYEGFGMPILEAMSYKQKLLLSDIPVFKEIAGPKAFYCDKDNVKDIANSITNSLEKPYQKTVLPDWSWPKNSKQLLSKIDLILEK